MARALASVVFGVGLALSGFGALAQPAETGWYIGASFGQAKADVDCSGTIACDDKDSSWKIFGGYQINRNFAVELGYSDLGAVTASTPSFVLFPLVVPAANLEIEATAWELVAVGSLPVTDGFSVFGKLGVYRADTDARVDFGALGSTTESDSNTDLTFGIGVRYDFTRNFGVRAEYQFYSAVAAGFGEEADVDVMSVGLVWRF
jgi:OOP family OmpA-OmpF porin